MGWSITSYDSLRLLYIDVDGRSYIFRKSLTKFKILGPDVSFVEMYVFDDVYGWNPLSAGAYDPVSLNVRSIGNVVPFTQTLYYRDADYPIAVDLQDLLDQLNGLLLSADVKVEKNGVFVGEEQTINFIEGANVTITAVDNPANSRVDVTIAAAGGGGPSDDPFPKILMLMGG